MEHSLKLQKAHQKNYLYPQLNLILKAAASMNKWKKLAGRSMDRHNRLTQLVNTEELYLKDLVMLKQKVKQQLQAAKIIDYQQSNQMFPNLQSMIRLSQQIHIALKTKLNSWDRKTTKIGDTMLQFSRGFLIYSDFFKNLNYTQQKLKKILRTSEQARTIQKKLSLPNRIITIQDLISKPFQRPLKYHLILRDYCGKTDPNHPDYANLKKAIELYQGVNQQNNNSVENKEKTQTLVNLQSKFGNIISEARYYIAEYDAICFQTPVIIYLFSDLAILVMKSHIDKELVRISFNKYSHVETAGDVLLFKNRLYIYGQKICIHLTFTEKMLRDDFYNSLKKLIELITQNEVVRKTIIELRVARQTQNKLKRKFSFTNLDPQLQRPIVASVVATEERINKHNEVKNYFVLMFYPERQNLSNSFSPHHTSILSEEQLIKLQNLIQQLYPHELSCLSFSSHLHNIVNNIEYYKNAEKKMQIKTILLQLFLNSLLRSPVILKRIDIVLYFLQISDSIWQMLKIGINQNCMCEACLNYAHKYPKYEDYNKQILQRQYNRVNFISQKRKTKYCERRTIQSQNLFSLVYPEFMLKAKSQDKITWCKAKLGWYNQTLTNINPSSKFVPKLKTKIYYRGFPIIIQFQINCQPNEPVRKIISNIAQRRETNFQDYVLVAEIGESAVVLCDDEPIGNIFRQTNQQEGVLELISHFFLKKQDLKINLYLQKYWVVFTPQDYVSPDRPRKMKVNSQVQSVMSRLASSELKLEEEEILQVYSLFMCKRYFSEIGNFDYEKVASKLKNKQEFYFPSKLLNESNIQKIYQNIQKLKQSNYLKSDFQLGVKILKKVSQKPGWSCIMFEAVQQLTDEEMPVKIGCDLQGIHIRQVNKLAFYLQFRLQDDKWSHHMSGNILMITDNQKIFKFIGREVWKVSQQIQFYKTYLTAFGRN